MHVILATNAHAEIRKIRDQVSGSVKAREIDCSLVFIKSLTGDEHDEHDAQSIDAMQSY